MTVVSHANKMDFWLITQQAGTTTYTATLINAASYTAGTFTKSVSTGVGNAMSAANFSYSQKLKMLAVSPQGPNIDVEILTFDNTGVATSLFQINSFIPNTGTATTGNQSIYDVQWDPKGQYIYISRTGDATIAADLFQYDLTAPTTSLASILPAPVFRSYGLQLGPDSAMYHLYQAVAAGPLLVDKFTRTDTIASSVVRTADPFAGTNFNGTQFPSFLPVAKVVQTVDFTFDANPNCQNTPTNFYPAVTPNADSLKWSFGDGVDTTTWSPIHTYANAGNFNVKLVAYYQGQRDSTTKAITITPFSLKLTLVQDTTACRCQLPARKDPAAPCSLPNFSVTVKVKGGTPTSYLWSNGETTATLHPDSAGYYYVVVKDVSGCSTYAGVNVKEFKLQDQRQNIWYFGNHAGIDFNKMPAVALNTSAMDAPEGCAIMCDRNGQVIFYTDGDKVWDKNNVQIDAGIGGDPLSAQSSIIIPLPGDETLYYIFTTRAIDGDPSNNNEMRYSLYDLKQNAVVIKNVLMFSKSTEHLAGNDNWVIAHENGNNTFRAYPISATGIGSPVYSAIGDDVSFQSIQNGQGYMKLGGKNNLAMAIATPGVSNIVDLFDFVDSTGLITNFRKIDLATTAGQVYGVEFSGGGNKLFATVDGLPTPSLLYEYAIDSLGKVTLKNKQSVAAELGAIELAPNGQIYVATNDGAHNSSLASIAPNEDLTLNSSFQLSGFPLLGGTNSRLGLPNFKQMISNAFGGPAFTYEGTCFGQPTTFTGTPRDPIDTFSWNFGDGGTSTELSPVHQFAADISKPVTYRVVFHVVNRCPDSKDSVVQMVTINPLPPRPTLAAASVLCNGPVVLDANSAGLPGMHYQWSTGDTTRTITVNKQILRLSVTNTDANGCSNTAIGGVGDPRPKVDLGPDRTLCQSSSVPVLNATNPNATYAWQVPAGVTPSNTATQVVDVSSPATLTAPQQYSVVVTVPIDATTNCTGKDTVVFTVKALPTATFTGTNPSGGCLTPTGSTSLTLNGPDAQLYSYFISGPGGPNIPQSGQDQSIGAVITNTQAIAGAYFATVTNQVSQCAQTFNVNLSDNTVTVALNGGPFTTCSTVAPAFHTTNFTLPLTYVVKTASGTTAIASTSSATADFSTTALPAGDYSITVTSGSCTASANFTIGSSGPPTNFGLTADVCATPVTITATPNAGNPTFVWTGTPTGTTSGATSNILSVTLPAGQFTYSATGSEAGYCPTTQSIKITVPPPYTPSFTQTGNCSSQVTLSAFPVGNFTYNWFLQDAGGALNFVASGQQIFVNTTGTYAVEVSDLNGCKKTTATQVVNVYGELTSTIMATQACNDNKPFTLTATSNNPDGKFTWYLNNTLIPGATTASIDQISEGTYKVVVSTLTCKDSSELMIKKAPIPFGSLPPTAIICNDPDNHDPSTSKVNLDPGNFVTYNWLKDNVTLSYTQEIYTAESEGTYSVELTNIYGCKGTDQTLVVNNCEPVVTAPNVFRPGSGTIANEKFHVFSFFITDEFQIFIFNRWGEMIYQSNDKNFQWNGTFGKNGEPLPGGTYAYVIKYVSSYRPEQGIQEKHGGVVLLR